MQKINRQVSKPIDAIGMQYADIHTGRIDSISKSKSFVEKRGIITSGSLFSLDVYDNIGPFREEFFIDSIDYDYCMRARAKGYRIIKVCKVGMLHSLGRTKQYSVRRIKVQTTNHNAMRRYYMYRNSTVLAMEHFLNDPFYSFAVFWFQFKTLFLVQFLEEDKHIKFRCMFRGISYGWRKRLGRVFINFKRDN